MIMKKQMLSYLKTTMLLSAVGLLIGLSACSEEETEQFEERCIDKIKGSWIVDRVYIKQTTGDNPKLQEDQFNDWSQFKLTCYSDFTYVWEDVSGIIEPGTGSFSFSGEDCQQVSFDSGPYELNVNYLTTERFEFTLEVLGFKSEPREFYFRLIPLR